MGYSLNCHVSRSKSEESQRLLTDMTAKALKAVPSVAWWPLTGDSAHLQGYLIEVI